MSTSTATFSSFSCIVLDSRVSKRSSPSKRPTDQTLWSVMEFYFRELDPIVANRAHIDARRYTRITERRESRRTQRRCSGVLTNDVLNLYARECEQEQAFKKQYAQAVLLVFGTRASDISNNHIAGCSMVKLKWVSKRGNYDSRECLPCQT